MKIEKLNMEGELDQNADPDPFEYSVWWKFSNILKRRKNSENNIYIYIYILQR